MNENDDFIDEVSVDTKLISSAIGGWQGVLDTSLATTVFLVVFVATGNSVKPAVVSAVGAGLVLAIIRLIQRRSLQQVLSGFVGVGLSAFLASRTGHSQNFFLLGIIQNAVYFALCLVSLLVKRPLVGYMIERFKGTKADWRSAHLNAHKYSAATWIWVAIFALRLLVTVPLYLSTHTAWLATAKLILGTPLYAFGVYLTFLVIKAQAPQETES